MSPPAFDLSVLSGCDHAIYDYGTFGFWGAFLTRGNVFCPKHLVQVLICLWFLIYLPNKSQRLCNFRLPFATI